MDFGLSDEEKMIIMGCGNSQLAKLLLLEAAGFREEIAGRRFPDLATLRELQQKAKTAGCGAWLRRRNTAVRI